MTTIDGLFAPLTIGKTTLANRFIMPGMQRGWSVNGAPSQQLADYYRERIEGGVAMIISESCAVDHPSATANPLFSWLRPDTVDAWAACADAIRSAGGEFLIQLWHEGARRDNADGGTISPSGIGYRDFLQGRAASHDDLAEIRTAFVRSARLAQQAGATGVEVHCAHGYLLDMFLWPLTNQRNDDYGGDIANRARFSAEIVAAIRAACGPDFLISMRFSQWKEHDYAARIAETPEELETLIHIMRDAGVDIFHASTRRFWLPEWEESNWNFAGWVRHFGGKPTITVGSVGLNTDVMESLMTDQETTSTLSTSLQLLADRFAAGEFDLVSVGRSLISDADWVKKVRAGDYDAVRTFHKSHLKLKPESAG